MTIEEITALPPAAEGLPAGALDSATRGATALDANAGTPYGRNVLAHALAGLQRDGWLRELPDADAEQQHLVDEIVHADDFDHFQHGDFPQRCGEHSQPITVRVCTMPDEAER